MTYHYKRPPRKRKAVALDVPAVVTTKRSRLRGDKQDGCLSSELSRYSRRPSRKSGGSGFFINDPAGPGRGSATQHRAMRNVTAP